MNTRIPTTIVYNNLHFHLDSCVGDYYVLIEDLYVAPENRRKGEGRKLLKAVIKEALTKSPEVYIYASPSNDSNPIPMNALIKFYESEGFRFNSTDFEGGVMMKYFQEENL